MAGYEWRSRPAPVFTETDKRAHALEQENAKLRDRMKQFESLANQWGAEKRAALAKVKKLEMELATERTQLLENTRVCVSEIDSTNRDRVRGLLATLRKERQELAGERSRRQHAETFLSRSEQRTDKVRTKLERERVTHRQTVVSLQETVAGLEETIGELRARLAQRHDVVTETRVKQLEGALADQQAITADRERERDIARGEAIAAWSTLDRTHTVLTRNQLSIFEAKRLANMWDIPFEGEVAS